IEMQSSQLKALQERLAAAEGETAEPAVAAAPAPEAAEPAAPAETPADAAPVADQPAAATPWYLNPMVLIGAGLVLIGGLVLALRGKRKPVPLKVPPRRISDDDAVKASLPGARAADAD